MFTLEQIKTAHSKVKSGIDFPKYIQDLIQLGITEYQTYVNDGHTLFTGKNDYTIQSEAKYPPLTIADTSDKNYFQQQLKEHQQGKTDYPAFCKMSADSGIEKWVVNMEKMTCTYYDKVTNEMLAEIIPTPS